MECQQVRKGNVENRKTKERSETEQASQEVQYIQACKRTSAVEISESRDRKILAFKMSVAVNQQGHGSCTEKATDLDLT